MNTRYTLTPAHQLRRGDIIVITQHTHSATFTRTDRWAVLLTDRQRPDRVNLFCQRVDDTQRRESFSYTPNDVAVREVTS